MQRDIWTWCPASIRFSDQFLKFVNGKLPENSVPVGGCIALEC